MLTGGVPTGARNPHAIASDASLTSTARARQLFEWLISPMTSADFYALYYEKKHFVIQRNQPAYYEGWFGKTDMDNIMRNSSLELGPWS